MFRINIICFLLRTQMEADRRQRLIDNLLYRGTQMDLSLNNPEHVSRLELAIAETLIFGAYIAFPCLIAGALFWEIRCTLLMVRIPPIQFLRMTMRQKRLHPKT